jgi:hypothetical protein
MMVSTLFISVIFGALLICPLLVFGTVRSRREVVNPTNKERTKAGTYAKPEPTPAVQAASSKRIVERFQEALADCIILPSQAEAFNASASNYFAQQSTTTKPACIVRPGTVKQLSEAVVILHEEFLARRHDKDGDPGFVSVRSGGHSYARASASIDGGVLVDLSLFSDVTISHDGSSVAVGTGARWNKVYQILEAKNLAVPGGRNSGVGVGGFTLGGELCFYFSKWNACVNAK